MIGTNENIQQNEFALKKSCFVKAEMICRDALAVMKFLMVSEN